MKVNHTIILLLFLVIFILYSLDTTNKEGMADKSTLITNSPTRCPGDVSDVPYRCPNILIQKGAQFFLYNSKLANVPGVNPIVFQSLEDYSEFVQWQRQKGINCPVLQLQESFDAQGNPVYKAYDNLNEKRGGLPNLQLLTN